MAPDSEKSISAPATKTGEKLRKGRWTRSGMYSWVNSKRLPRGRAFAKTRRELSILREDLIRQHGGEKITPSALILVDSIIEALGIQKLLGLYVRQHGVIDEQSAKAGRLELNPILAKNWISYGNTVRQALLALKEITTSTETEEVLSPLEIAELIDADKAEKAMEDGRREKREGNIKHQVTPEPKSSDNLGGTVEGEV